MAHMTYADAVAQLLVAKRKTVAVAEASTCGLLGYLMTQSPGASRYFLGGVTAYSYHVKERVLGIPLDLLEKEGSVSRAVALAMARSIRALCGAQIGLAETGIAGPCGGTLQKPVGLFHIALSTEGIEEYVEKQFTGDREACRQAAARAALEMLEEYLASLKP